MSESCALALGNGGGRRLRSKAVRSGRRWLFGGVLIAFVLAWLLGQWIDPLDDEASAAASTWRARHAEIAPPADRSVLVVDFTRPSVVPRARLIDDARGTTESYFVTHGRGSGGAWVESVSNEPRSHQSSAGAFLTGQVYRGAHGRSLRLRGIELGLNDNAFRRRIVIHGAEYAEWTSVLWNFGRLGRSEGCLVFSPDVVDHVIDRLGEGSLVYVHFR